MNAILDRAVAHYAAQERQKVLVPEWGVPGQPLEVFFTQLTIAERKRIFRVDDRGRAPDGPTACVRAVMLKATDASGKRMFDDMAEHDLTHKVDSGIVGRIAAEILKGADLDDEELDAEKNG